jgi:hypothetical protein
VERLGFAITISVPEGDALGFVALARDGVEIAVPRRRTPYGADEIYVRTVGGHIIGFAAFPAANDKWLQTVIAGSVSYRPRRYVSNFW